MQIDIVNCGVCHSDVHQARNVTCARRDHWSYAADVDRGGRTLVGVLIYDGVRVEFDDLTLAHLQIVIVQAIRRGESLLLSWWDALEEGDGRTAAWISASLPVRFEFDARELPPIDRRWISALAASSESRTGLVVKDLEGRPVRPLHSTIARH